MNRLLSTGLMLTMTAAACGSPNNEVPVGMDEALAAVEAVESRFGCPIPIVIEYVEDADAGVGFDGSVARARAEQGLVILDDYVLGDKFLSTVVTSHEAVHACTDDYVAFDKPYTNESGVTLLGSSGFQVKMTFPDGTENFLTFPEEGAAELLAKEVTGLDTRGVSHPTYITMSMVTDDLRTQAGLTIDELQEMHERSDVESFIAAINGIERSEVNYGHFITFRDAFHQALGLPTS